MGARLIRAIHVAGVIDFDEAKLLIDCGIRFLGFPFALDHHKEDLTVEAAAAIVSKLGNHANFFLITYLTKAQDIRRLCDALAVNMVQLHGQSDLKQIQLLRQEAPELRIIKSLIVRNDNEDLLMDEVQRYGPNVNSFITDTFDPKTGASGATGSVHDWTISRRLVELSKRPVILAGGLNPKNVRQAIHAVRPAGVDVHTGIEGQDGRKHLDLTKRFADEARTGFTDLGSETDHS
jgi:phosphoribosylanthranilate isomerase